MYVSITNIYLNNVYTRFNMILSNISKNKNKYNYLYYFTHFSNKQGIRRKQIIIHRPSKYHRSLQGISMERKYHNTITWHR
jgi:histidinol phosphatase-like enzyme